MRIARYTLCLDGNSFWQETIALDVVYISHNFES